MSDRIYKQSQHSDGKHQFDNMGTEFEHGDAQCVVTAFAREDLFFSKMACPDPYRIATSLFWA